MVFNFSLLNEKTSSIKLTVTVIAPLLSFSCYATVYNCKHFEQISNFIWGSKFVRTKTLYHFHTSCKSKIQILVHIIF